MIGKKGFVLSNDGWIMSGIILGENEREYLIYLENGLYLIHKEFCFKSLEDAMKNQIERRKI